MANASVDTEKLQLNARLMSASRIIDSLSIAIKTRSPVSADTKREIERFRTGIELDAARERLKEHPEYAKASEVAEYFRLNSSILPAGEPRNEDVLWNAMICMRDALLSPHSSHNYDTALRACNEAIEFVRGDSQSIKA